MLKKRIIATIIVREGIAVQSKLFKEFLPLGKPEIAADFLSQWGADEIMLLDISAGIKRQPDYELIERVASKCRVPLTVGGGISSTGQIHRLLNCGADRVSLNQTAREHPVFIQEAAAMFGSQCIIVSVDCFTGGTRDEVYDYKNRRTTGADVLQFVSTIEKNGAGELIVNSVERDGTCAGYNLELLRKVCNRVAIPVIAQGGAGSAEHIVTLFQNTAVSAAAAANFFHFSEHSISVVKSAVCVECPIRHERNTTYADHVLDQKDRLLKKPDETLEKMLFIKIEPEII